MSEVNEINNAEELLNATVDVLKEKKNTGKALAEVTKRVLDQSGGDKSNWRIVTKVCANKGRAWLGNPLDLDKEAEHKDSISPLFIKLLATITALEEFNQTDEVLKEYLDALQSRGITITIDHNAFEHADTDSIEPPIDEELESTKSYMRTIENYSDEIKNEHAVRANELNFCSANSYMSIAQLYKRGVVDGKDIQDTCQDILTDHEMFDTAVGLIQSQAQTSMGAEA